MTDGSPVGHLLLDRFRIDELTGDTVMADAFRATDVETGEVVAVTLFHRHLASDPAFCERLRREADAVAQISHPGIVQVYGQGDLDDRPFLILEWVDGITLAELLDRKIALPPERAVSIVKDVLIALQHAHAQGLIHRDVNPRNILLTREGRAKLTHFGSAQTATLSGTGEVPGAVQYLAPERLLGHIATPASDVYSVGAVLYELLTGRPPVVGDVPALVAAQHAQRPPNPPSMLRPGLSAWLNQAVLLALARNPSERYPSAEAMLRALEPSRFGAAGGTPLLFPRRRFKGAASRPWRTIPRNLVALGLIVVLLVIGVVAGRELWDARAADALASSGTAQPGSSPPTTPRPGPTSGVAASGEPATPQPRTLAEASSLTPIPTEQPVQSAPTQGASSQFQQVGVVWPHDGQGNAVGLDQARAVNVSLWPRVQVNCDVEPETGLLWVARDNEPARPVTSGAMIVLASIDGAQFPMLVINDVPADTAANPTASYRFFVRSPDSNVWVHAADPRSKPNEPFVPTEQSEPNPSQIDARIHIVWPHNGRGEPVPVEQATAVNVAVDLFAHGTTRSVPMDFDPKLVLRVAEGNGPLREQDEAGQPIALASKITHTIDDRTFPRWVFNNVPVQPGRQYHFLVDVTEGVEMAFPSIWTHGHDSGMSQSPPSIPPSCSP
ncbi:MAG TPA: serine/threonine-protein kinase [Chloroflexota bacterium]|nr:serine/threonine-protein kinase [Chloroflexota bacterium]